MIDRWCYSFACSPAGIFFRVTLPLTLSLLSLCCKRFPSFSVCFYYFGFSLFVQLLGFCSLMGSLLSTLSYTPLLLLSPPHASLLSTLLFFWFSFFQFFLFCFFVFLHSSWFCFCFVFHFSLDFGIFHGNGRILLHVSWLCFVVDYNILVVAFVLYYVTFCLFLFLICLFVCGDCIDNLF